MKALSVIISSFGIMAVFGFGFTMNRVVPTESAIEQIHLSCWNSDDSSSLERIRLVINKDLHGLAWFSNYKGDPTGEGTLAPHTNINGTTSASTIEFSVFGDSAQSFVAQVPSFVFQPHVKTLKMTVQKNEVPSSLECRKINLQKRQTALN